MVDGSEKFNQSKKYPINVDAGLLYTKYNVQPNGNYDSSLGPVKVLGLLDDPGSHALVLEFLNGRLYRTGEQLLLYGENREQLEEQGFRELSKEAMSKYLKEYQIRHNLDDHLEPIIDKEGIQFGDVLENDTER